MPDVVAQLMASDDPCVRYRTLVDVRQTTPGAKEAGPLREAIRSSARARRLLAPQDRRGRMPGVYSKFTGAHWVLTDLADIGYPPGDASLTPLRDQVYEFWLLPERTRERVVDREAARYKSRPGVPIIKRRARHCASQEGNAHFPEFAHEAMLIWHLALRGDDRTTSQIACPSSAARHEDWPHVPCR